MALIKITGYIETDELDPENVDLEHPTGLTDVGFMNLVQGESGMPLTLSDVMDIELELK